MNPTVAAQLTDTLALGVGLDVYISDLDLRENLPWAATGVPAPDGHATLRGSGAGLGFNAGVTWQCTSRQRLALTYRSAVGVNYEGSCRVSDIPGALQQLVAPRTDFSTHMDFPAMSGLGYSIQVSDKLKLEADVEWLQFGTYDQLTIDAGADNPLLHPPADPTPPMAPLSIPQRWKDSWTFGLGGEYQVRPGLALRAGYIFIQSPIPDETLSPTLPDADRHVVSVGAGFQQGSHVLDVALLHSFFPSRKITNNQSPAYNGTYDLIAQLVAVSYSYLF